MLLHKKIDRTSRLVSSTVQRMLCRHILPAAMLILLPAVTRGKGHSEGCQVTSCVSCVLDLKRGKSSPHPLSDRFLDWGWSEG